MSEILMGGALREESSVEWWTPPSVFNALGLDFDLDPCAPPKPAAPWIPAEVRWSAPLEGAPSNLTVPWMGRIWLNPPYGRETQRWVRRLIEHAHSEYPSDEGIALVFTRTDAKWAQEAMRAADAVCFIAGRVSFIEGNPRPNRKGHNPANGSMLLAFGPVCAEAVLRSGLGVAFKSPGGEQ